MAFAIAIIPLIFFGAGSVIIYNRFNRLDESIRKLALGDDFDLDYYLFFSPCNRRGFLF